ncbi:MAG: ATP-binding protein [Lachnospiraceae bacterium]|nr:ATP-binding protein [Lachnospiraceae bacterium]
MIRRDKYLNKLIANRWNGFPKVITGIRRCGKSYLLKELYRQYLLDNGLPEEEILVIELDDDRNARYRDPIFLGEYVREYCNSTKQCVVFIDEIQLVYSIVNPNITDGKHVLAKENDSQVISFVDVVLGLAREKNIDLYVTGSNSKMLSSDVITEFRDKAVNINLAPLSFDELYSYKGGDKTEVLYDYMQYGGMPLAVLRLEDEKKEYLKGLFETTYIRDIIERNKLRKGSTLDELCNILSASTGELLNAYKISNTYKSAKHEEIDTHTVEKYVEYFVDAFLIREARRYDVKGRSEIGALRKYYFADTGLRNARLNFAFPDEGQMLENIIYNELLYQGYSVNVGTFDIVEKDGGGKSVRKTCEVDFFARKGIRQYYIQVSVNIDDAETRAREKRPYFMLKDQIQKIIVINKPISECLDENGFTIIGVTDFLLRFIK